MLRLLLGRAGAGKSTAILRRIAASGGARRQLLIVPEQASHETERRLCAVAGNQVSLYAEVLSFTRLGRLRFRLAQFDFAVVSRVAGQYQKRMFVEPKSEEPAITLQLTAKEDPLQAAERFVKTYQGE